MKKILALLLALVCMLGMIPISASAANRPTTVVQIDVSGTNCEADTYKITDTSIYLGSSEVIYELTGATDRKRQCRADRLSPAEQCGDQQLALL